MQYDIYANDTQLYIAFNPLDNDESAKAKLNIEKFICIIKDFFWENRVKLNDSKTEVLIIGTENKLKNVIFNDIKIRQVQIKAVKKKHILERCMTVRVNSQIK